MDWLLASIDATRPHEVGSAISWHARAMTLAWGILAPLAVVVARYFKVLPGQDWPRVLDTKLWWRFHWMTQSGVLLLSFAGIALVYGQSQDALLHARLGYTIVALAGIQVFMGIFRGTKGGPTAPARDGSLHGDHYDMTRWRVFFEWVHKLMGYALLLLAVAVILLGLWHANAPVWMWLTLGLWWLGLIIAAHLLQKRGWAVDTYQAIWGPGLEHPGNRRKPIGWGISRADEQPGE